MADYILKTQLEDTQFTNLIDAITNGSGAWKTAATGVTSFNVSGISAKEFMIIQKVTLPNNSIVSASFIVPKASMLTIGTMLDGYYYSSNHNGCFAVKITGSTISIDTAWLHVQYGQSAITTGVIDIYYR